MILIDPRDGGKIKTPGIDMPSDLLVKYIRAEGVIAEKSILSYGDAAFNGNGDEGEMLVGVERKTLGDMLNCIDDARYNMQRVGMKQLYRKSFLLLEGEWEPNYRTGLLRTSQGNGFYDRGDMGLYSKLYNYLVSVSLSGVTVTFTRNIHHTAYNICCLFRYFSKKWSQHTSLLEHHRLDLPHLDRHPSLVRMWASDINGVGIKNADAAAEYFKKPITLAKGDELDWVRIGSIGGATAQKIVRQIKGEF